MKMLANIHSVAQIRELSYSELRKLASEIRLKIIDVVGKNGGHLASNLGVVELTIALHRIFSTPDDAIIWDVGHQCYTHKILTGRFDSFDRLRKRNGISGFPKREESTHDFFDTGHASTSISAALGLLTAKRMKGDTGKVIAVIGDGALSGGLAMEALGHAGQLTKDLIVVVNDNKMSISANTSAISKYLSKLTMTLTYQLFRKTIDTFISKIPFLDKYLTVFVYRFKRSLKGLFFKENLFVDLGFEYVGPINGHNIAEMESIFKRVKNIARPVVIHVVTKKGKGYSPAENDPATFHGIGPFNLSDGTVEKVLSKSFTQVFSEEIIALGAADPSIVTITAAMAKGTGLAAFQHRFPDRCFDVGIAEEHAVTFAAGLAAGGLRPIVAIYSTFMQRAVDQLIHDISLQKLPAVFVLDRAGAIPDDGETHQGIFDIALFSCVPSLVMLAPSSATELRSMLAYALSLQTAVMLRYPKTAIPVEVPEFSEPIVSGRGVLHVRSFPDAMQKVLVVCTGGLYSEVAAAVKLLQKKGASADIYTLRFIKPIDEAYFLDICSAYSGVLFAEDGIRTGGISEHLEKLVLQHLHDVKTSVRAFPEGFYEQGTRNEILADAGLSATCIAAALKELLQ